MTLEPLTELTAAAEQLAAIEQVRTLLRYKIAALEAAGKPADAYRQVSVWLFAKSQERLNAALAASHSQEA